MYWGDSASNYTLVWDSSALTDGACICNSGAGLLTGSETYSSASNP